VTLIAQFVDTHVFGGAEAIAVNLAEKLKENGHFSIVFHFGNPEMEEFCLKRNVSHCILPNLNEYRSWKTVPNFAWKFAQTLSAHKVGLLHSHLFGSVTAGALAGVFARVPHVGTLHDLYTLEESPIRIRALQLSTFLGTRLVSVAHVLEEYCRNRATFPRARLRTIHNGVPPGEPTGETSSLSREALGFSSEETIFISVGRLVALKRQDLLVRAFAKLRVPQNARLIILGDGPEKKRLEALISELKLEGLVSLFGYRSEVAPYLKLSDCFVLASSTECLSCSILEAMAVGLPILATPVGGNVELLQDGLNGYFLEPTVDAIGERLQYAVDHRWSLRELGDRSQKRFEENFTLTRMTDEYLKLYNELL